MASSRRCLLRVMASTRRLPSAKARPWPRIPHPNRAAVREPLQRIAVLLRDPAITVADRTLRRVMGFVTDPASPAYGRYPNQAGFVAYSLLEEVSALSPHLEV